MRVHTTVTLLIIMHTLFIIASFVILSTLFYLVLKSFDLLVILDLTKAFDGIKALFLFEKKSVQNVFFKKNCIQIFSLYTMKFNCTLRAISTILINLLNFLPVI